MLKRGYPATLLEVPPYDDRKRRDMLRRLRSRDTREVPKMQSQPLEVFKCAFSTQLCRLGIRTQYKRMLATLRRHLGDQFLKNDKFVIAHPTKSNLFLREYQRNFVSSTIQRTNAIGVMDDAMLAEGQGAVGFFSRKAHTE